VLAGGMIGSQIGEDSALPMLEAAIARERGSPTPRWSLIARAEAWAIMPTGRQRGQAAAESVFLRASDALKREKNPGPEAGATLGFLIQALLSGGHAAEAVDPARLLVTTTKQRLGADHILVGQAQNLLAGAYTQLGRLDEARATYDSAITLSRRHTESDKMYLLNMYSGRVIVEIKQHDTRAAEESISEMRRLLPAFGAQRPVAEIGVEQLAATVDVENGRIVSARQHLVRAVDIARTTLGPQATRTVAAEAKLKAFDAEHPSR
jgi:tetratricopeptide (TPR) repeat protein